MYAPFTDPRSNNFRLRRLCSQYLSVSRWNMFTLIINASNAWTRFCVVRTRGSGSKDALLMLIDESHPIFVLFSRACAVFTSSTHWPDTHFSGLRYIAPLPSGNQTIDSRPHPDSTKHDFVHPRTINCHRTSILNAFFLPPPHLHPHIATMIRSVS